MRGAARPTKSSRKTAGRASMILRLSERVSEGDAKFQGFCGRWNKWEGQVERGIDVCHETVRFWWNRFAPLFAGEIRRRRLARRNWSN